MAVRIKTLSEMTDVLIEEQNKQLHALRKVRTPAFRPLLQQISAVLERAQEQLTALGEAASPDPLLKRRVQRLEQEIEKLTLQEDSVDEAIYETGEEITKLAEQKIALEARIKREVDQWGQKYCQYLGISWPPPPHIPWPPGKPVGRVEPLPMGFVPGPPMPMAMPPPYGPFIPMMPPPGPFFPPRGPGGMF